MELLKKGIAEFFGTLILVFIGCGVGAFYGSNDAVATALAFGFTVAALCYVIGRISGCHVNPAISLAMLINKRINFKEFIVYVAFQFLGALAGAALLYFIISQTMYIQASYGMSEQLTSLITLGSNGFAKTDGISISLPGALIIEEVLTFIFCYVVLGATEEKKHEAIAGIVVGIALAAVHLIGVQYTGTSVNPARSFGPALMTAIVGGFKDSSITDLTQVWVFIVGPLLGAALAGLLYRFFNTKKQETAEKPETVEGQISIDEEKEWNKALEEEAEKAEEVEEKEEEPESKDEDEDEDKEEDKEEVEEEKEDDEEVDDEEDDEEEKEDDEDEEEEEEEKTTSNNSKKSQNK